MPDRAIQMAKEIDALLKAGKKGQQVIAALTDKFSDMSRYEFDRAFGIAMDEVKMSIEIAEEEKAELRAKLGGNGDA